MVTVPSAGVPVPDTVVVTVVVEVAVAPVPATVDTTVVVEGETTEGAKAYMTPTPIRRPTMNRPATTDVEAPVRFTISSLRITLGKVFNA